MTEKVRRPSARSDDLGNVVSALDFVLPRKREAAGDGRASLKLRVMDGHVGSLQSRSSGGYHRMRQS
jgi:hypothetical protein